MSSLKESRFPISERLDLGLGGKPWLARDQAVGPHLHILGWLGFGVREASQRILGPMGWILVEYEPKPSHGDLIQINFLDFVPNLGQILPWIWDRLCPRSGADFVPDLGQSLPQTWDSGCPGSGTIVVPSLEQPVSQEDSKACRNAPKAVPRFL